MHDPDWIAACHEAGHAVAAHVLGVSTASVGIDKRGIGEGRWTAAGKFNRAAMAETWPNYAIIGWMGRHVELLLFGRFEPRFLEEDDDNIERYLLTFLAGEAERRDFHLRLPGMAEAVAARTGFIEAVIALAKSLMHGEQLSGEESAAIITGSLNAALRCEAPPSYQD